MIKVLLSFESKYKKGNIVAGKFCEDNGTAIKKVLTCLGARELNELQ